MSTNKTQNYNLHSWVPEDDFIRSEFNDNFTGIDTALKTLSDGLTAETSARTAAVAAEKTAREQAVAAEATARQSAVTAETNARKQAVTAEQNARIAAINSLTTAKAELVIGSYQGGEWTTTNPNTRTINLGFSPKAVLFVRDDGGMGKDYDVSGGLILPSRPLYNPPSSNYKVAEITSTGFIVYDVSGASVNRGSRNYYYIAVK